MTSHLEEGRLQELIDGEVPSSELPPIQAHLAVCAECRARLEEARTIGAEADRLIETIDLTDAPARTVPRVSRSRPKAWIRNLAWAATLVIAAGVGYLGRSTGLARPTEALPRSERADTTTNPAALHADAGTPAPSPQPLVTRKPAIPRREADAVAGGARERARDVTPSTDASAPAERLQDEAKTAIAGNLRQLAAADSDSILKRSAKKAADSPARLEELATSGVADRRAAASPPAPALSKQAEPRPNANRLDQLLPGAFKGKTAEAPVEISFLDALKRLNGSLRLIEGMVPLRLEGLGADVRVVYPLASGVLLLSERLENGRLVYELVAPAGFPADSLERLRARVRD